MPGPVRILPLLFVLFCLSLAGAADTYVAGSGSSIKDWSQVSDWVNTKGGNRAICLYFFLAPRANDKSPKCPEAQFLEGSEFLDNAEVKKKLKELRCMKWDSAALSAPSKMPKGWPAEVQSKICQLKYGVLLFNSDFQGAPFTFSFGQANGKAFLQSCDVLMAYEAKKKEALEKAAKVADAKNAEEAKKADPTVDTDKKKELKLGGITDDDKDKKKEEKKAPPPPKPAAPDSE